MNILIVIAGVILLSSYANGAVPLYRLFRAATENHFYTTSYEEAMNAARNFGYIFETRPGYVAKDNIGLCASRVQPVYRLYKSGAKDDHFYTMDNNEAANAAQNLGYIREGIAFYCIAPTPPFGTYGCGASLGLRRYSRGTDHFYTTDANEGNAVQAGGARFEGIMCYIWNSANPTN